jgi:serine protease Do
LRVKKKVRNQFAVLVSALCLVSAPALSEPLDAKLFAERNSFVGLASSVTPSVVSIDVSKREVRQAAVFDDPMMRRFFGDLQMPERQERIFSGKGSGVIVSPEGLLITNHHVVEGASEISVTLHDGRKLEARLVGADPSTDVAVLKVETPGALPAARIGSSQSLPIGSWLMAVGNPHGLEETVTVGILSGKGRVIGAGLYDDFLQTDAAINPGNSGGGLFNSEGELVGINTAVAGQGIGFAIPIEMAQKVALDLQAHGKVLRGYLGVAIQELTPALREALRLPADVKGALLGQVLSSGPAARSGLRPGDVVVEFNGQPVSDQRDLLALVAQAQVGSNAPLTVWRQGRTETLSTSVAQRPDETIADSSPEPARDERSPESSGFRGVTLTPELAHRLQLPQSQGVLLQAVQPGSRAARAGLRAGDVITQADGQGVTTPEQLERILSQQQGNSIALLVARGDRQVFLALERAN